MPLRWNFDLLPPSTKPQFLSARKMRDDMMRYGRTTEFQRPEVGRSFYLNVTLLVDILMAAGFSRSSLLPSASRRLIMPPPSRSGFWFILQRSAHIGFGGTIPISSVGYRISFILMILFRDIEASCRLATWFPFAWPVIALIGYLLPPIAQWERYHMERIQFAAGHDRQMTCIIAVYNIDGFALPEMLWKPRLFLTFSRPHSIRQIRFLPL